MEGKHLFFFLSEDPESATKVKSFLSTLGPPFTFLSLFETRHIQDPIHLRNFFF